MSSLYKKNKKFYLLLILPALLLYSFAMLAPLFGGTIPYSFLKWNLMSGKKAFVGFDNYVKLFSDAKFWTSFGFNLFVGAFTIIGSNVFGFKLTVAGVDAKLVKHADQALFGKIDGFYVVTGAV